MPIRNLQHVAMQVPDLETGLRFYGDFGLTAQETGNGLIFRCDGRDQDQLKLYEGRLKRLHHICFGTREDELPALQAGVEQAGFPIIDPPTEVAIGNGAGDGIWFRDFDDMLFNIRAAEPAPWDTRPGPDANGPWGNTRIGRRHDFFDWPQIRPRRLGHVVVFTSDLARKTAFFENVLGSRRSDSVGPFMDFHYLPTGSDHHVFGFIDSHAPGLQHIAFEVANADEVCYGGQRMLDRGYLNAWGPGRHAGPGSNLFHYLRDPWLSCIEYFADMDYLPEGVNWQARRYMPGELPDLWGDGINPQFNVNFEAVATAPVPPVPEKL